MPEFFKNNIVVVKSLVMVESWSQDKNLKKNLEGLSKTYTNAIHKQKQISNLARGIFHIQFWFVENIPNAKNPWPYSFPTKPVVVVLGNSWSLHFMEKHEFWKKTSL